MITEGDAVHVEYVKDYRLLITFADGTCGEIDFRDDIVGRGGVFTPLEDIAFFKRVRVVEGGTIGWPNDVDFAPEVLYREIAGAPVTAPPAR